MEIQIQRAKNKEFFVRIVSRNGKELFRSSETYKRRQGARKAINSLLLAIVRNQVSRIDYTKK